VWRISRCVRKWKLVENSAPRVQMRLCPPELRDSQAILRCVQMMGSASCVV